MEITLEDGKYVYVEAHGRQDVLRYDEPWRDVTGDKFIGAMAHEIERLQQEVTNRNARAIEGDEAVAVREALVDEIVRLQQDLISARLEAVRPTSFKYDPNGQGIL